MYTNNAILSLESSILILLSNALCQPSELAVIGKPFSTLIILHSIIQMPKEDNLFVHDALFQSRFSQKIV